MHSTVSVVTPAVSVFQHHGVEYQHRGVKFQHHGVDIYDRGEPLAPASMLHGIHEVAYSAAPQVATSTMLKRLNSTQLDDDKAQLVMLIGG